MRTTRRHFLALTGAASAATLLRLDTAPAFAQSGPVKVGVLAAKAGVLAPVGESGLRGVTWAADRINAAGGMLGRVSRLNENYVTMEIAPSVEIQVQRPAVQLVLPKGTLKNIQ